MSTEFEEKVTGRAQVYRELGQGIKVLHEHARADVEYVRRVFRASMQTLTDEQHPRSPGPGNGPHKLLGMVRNQQRRLWAVQIQEVDCKRGSF